MPGSSEQIVRELFQRLGSGSLEDALELLGEDIVMTVPPSMSAEPDAYEGHQGARRYFAGFAGTIGDLTFEPLEIEEEEEGGVVIAWMRFGGRGVSSGVQVEQYAALICRVEDGKVVRLEPHPDMETARAVARGW